MRVDRTTIHPRGIVSLLSLILMATVTVTAVGAAAVIISELRQTESLDQSFTAVYAAEAGLEDGLFIVKSGRAANETLDETITRLNPPAPIRSQIVNGGTWEQRALLEEQFFVPRLPVDTSTHLELFDFDQPQGGPDVQSIVVTWGINCNRYIEMEVTMLTWETAGTPFGDPLSQRVFKEKYACNAVDLVCAPITLTEVAGEPFLLDTPYRMSFRVLIPDRNINEEEAAKCFAENLNITAYNDLGQVIDLPNRVVVRSTGRFFRSRQSLTASVPWRPPISGLFGFVVFSDTDLKK